MVTGPLLIVIFIVSLAFLLVTIIKFKLNAFVSLIITSFLTALLVRMPFGDITSAVADGFSGTIGGIGIVTGMGVMLGMLLFESGGINAIADKMIHLFGEKNSPAGLGIAAYFAGIPVFGDVVTVLFSTMVRALSRKTNISRLSFVSCYAVAASITAACVIPTAGPLAVCENMELNIGVFFVYSTLAGLVGFLTGGILWGKYLDRKEKKSGYVRVLDEFELEEQKTMEKEESSDKKISFGAAMLILLIPILMIVIGSFASVLLPENNGAVPYLAFIGNKNLAMAVGVLCAMLIAKPYIKGSMSEIMGRGLDQMGMILLITGAGGAFGKVIQLTGIGDYMAQVFGNLHIPVLILGFALAQIIRLAQGSTTVAITTTSAILYSTVIAAGTSPILAAVAICAGGVGLSLPNDSGFWSISKFNRISIPETFRCWTVGGFLGGLGILGAVLILSLFQNVLPGLL